MDSNKSTATLSSFVDQLDSYVRHLQPLNRANAEDIIQYVREYMIQKKINVTYEHLSCLETGKAFRLVLTTKRDKANFGIQLVRECNGAIILVEEIPDKESTVLRCRVVCRPAHDFNPKINNTQWVNTNIKNGLYEIYFIEDGSTVNLYFENKWIVSTKNSFDISGTVWRGKSYGDVLTEVLSRYDFKYENLDTNKTYTIGFKHPAHHPFGQGANPVLKAWFIQSTNNTTEEINYAEKIGLPFQERARITAQGGQFWQTATKTAQDALQEFTTAKQKNVACVPFLGYILRSRDRSRTRHYSDILIESSLLSEIRNCVYQLPYISNKTQLERTRQSFKDMDYVVIDAYLDSTKRPIFEVLFPQYQELYKKYDDILSKAIDGIYNLLKRDPNGIKYKPRQDPPSDIDKIIVTFAPVAASHVSLNAREKLSLGDNPPGTGNAWPEETTAFPQEEKTKKLIHTAIVNPKFTDKYIQIF